MYLLSRQTEDSVSIAFIVLNSHGRSDEGLEMPFWQWDVFLSPSPPSGVCYVEWFTFMTGMKG